VTLAYQTAAMNRDKTALVARPKGGDGGKYPAGIVNEAWTAVCDLQVVGGAPPDSLTGAFNAPNTKTPRSPSYVASSYLRKIQLYECNRPCKARYFPYNLRATFRVIAAVSCAPCDCARPALRVASSETHARSAVRRRLVRVAPARAPSPNAAGAFDR